jgi:hypothetical protein
MSRHHLRHDKTCLNCGSTVEERYCSHCGQENTEPKESFGHLIGHFLEDVTHYDSQLLTTIKDLIFKPGFLTSEYNAGKRISYLNPIRMYIFISAVFFLVAFSGHKEEENTGAVTNTVQVNIFKQHLADSLRGAFKTKKPLSKTDSISNKVYSSLATRLDTASAVSKDKDESITANINNYGEIKLILQEHKYASTAAYDSAQRKLPDTAKDGALGRYATKKLITLVHKSKNSGGEATITRNIAHDIPKIMFVLLPLFALFISIAYNQLFYGHKKYYYTQHAIFSLHFHSFVFIIFLIVSVLSMIITVDFNVTWLVIIAVVTQITIFVYLVAALKRVYREALWKSIIKGISISLLYVVTVILCMCVVFALTFVLA